MPTNKTKNKSFTQTDGVQEVLTPNYHMPFTQVSFDTNSTTGSVLVKVKYHPDSAFENLYEEDGVTPLSIDLTNLKTFQLEQKWVYSFCFEPTNVDASYTPLISSGIMPTTYR